LVLTLVTITLQVSSLLVESMFRWGRFLFLKSWLLLYIQDCIL